MHIPLGLEADFQHNDALASDPMHPTLFTLGYEGLGIDAFIARLQAAQVKTVVDVRELPLSRKKGFLKSAFCAALSAHGMAYLHAPVLGCPKFIRNQYKADGNWQIYMRDFLEPIGRANCDPPDRSFRFHFDARLGAKPQTVQQHGKAKQQHIALKWKWN